jgi:membrane protease YdiL (CAAX protease family)
MSNTPKPSLAAPVAIWALYAGLTAAANYLWARGAAAAGEVVFFGGAITLVGLAAPLYLASRRKLDLPLWPAAPAWDGALGVLAVVFLFSRVELLTAIFREGRPWSVAAVTFLKAAPVNLATAVATFGVLLPALKRRMPTATAAVLAAVAFALAHLGQYRLMPGAVTISGQLILLAFGVGYALYYVWSRSLLLAAFLYQLIMVTAAVYRRDAFGAAWGGAAWAAVAAAGVFLVLALVYRRRFGASRYSHF